MSEMEPVQFSDDERGEIGIYAMMIAECGQLALDHLTRYKVRLCMEIYHKADSIKSIDDRLAFLTAFKHDVDVINEVIRQTRSIRQLMGVDELSQLDRDAQEAGQGSIFDENSPIGARLKKYLR